MVDFAFHPDRVGTTPIYRQVAEYLRGLIETDRLRSGVKLPATRELARQLGLNRNTVTQAYQELLAEGYLTAHVGQGTFVADRTSVRAPAVTPSGGRQPRRHYVWGGLFAQRTHGVAVPESFLATLGARITFDFRGGQVATDAQPANELRKALTSLLDYRMPELAAHPDPFGWLPLREAVAHYLVNRGLVCDLHDVLIVNGGQQALDLAARILLDPGDTVVMEEPGYFGAAAAFTAAQSTLVGVGVDAEGLRTDDLARVLQARRVKLIYATPAAQCPTGVIMSERRRQELLSLADRYQVPIFEDDYDSELRYGGPPLAAIKTQDAAGQVIYAGTFSKVLFPGLRVGYVVAAPPVLEKLVLSRWSADVSTGVLAQAALAELMSTGAFERHVRRVRTLYAERYRAMLGALRECMPAEVAWTEPGGGFSVWLALPAAVDPDRMFYAALDAGIAYTNGDVFYRDGRRRGNVALSFASSTPDTIREGVARLADLIRAHLRGSILGRP